MRQRTYRFCLSLVNPGVGTSPMTYVTRITLQSGDRVVLDDTVAEIKQFVSRKGAEMTGPHPRPPTECSVPLSKSLTGGTARFPPWSYTIYSRDMVVKGYDSIARALAERTYPASVHVTLELDQVGSVR